MPMPGFSAPFTPEMFWSPRAPEWMRRAFNDACTAGHPDALCTPAMRQDLEDEVAAGLAQHYNTHPEDVPTT